MLACVKVTGTHAAESTVEVAEGKDLADIAGCDGLASNARPAGDSDPGDSELEQGLEFRSLL
jgi:hypothetical protein